MKYPPGSFTKNFAWHGEGFLRLHSTIKAGFSATLQRVNQGEWRKNCGEDSPSMQLVPLNFFLHQRRIKQALTISVDELVFQSVSVPHSLAFDRLAMFSFHLNIAGDGAGREIGHRGWAAWANEFVREELWLAGGWQSDKLKDAPLRQSLKRRISAQPEVLTKCFTNYRYFFGLADYQNASGIFVNTGYDDWIVPALFLTWDRWHLENPTERIMNSTKLIEIILELEVHKLVGATEDVVRMQAEWSAADYIELGARDRFSSNLGDDVDAIETAPGLSAPTRKGVTKKKTSTLPAAWSGSTATAAEKLKAMSIFETDAAVERQIREYHAQKRNRSLATIIKQLYDHKCLFCESLLQVGQNPDVYYVEAAHIKPVGKPHNGPDKPENLIPLCPNHHLQLDRGMLRLKVSGSTFSVESRIKGDPLNGKEINLHGDHSLDAECVHYHFNWFSRRR